MVHLRSLRRTDLSIPSIDRKLSGIGEETLPLCSMQYRTELQRSNQDQQLADRFRPGRAISRARLERTILDMTDWPITLKALTAIYVILGMVWFFLSIFVLQTYETTTKRRPPAITFWPFNRAIRDEFPDAARWARFIFILGLVLMPFWWLYI